VTGRAWLRLVPVLLAVSCGTTDPSPSPSPTPDTCVGTPSAYARAVTDWWIPRCSLEQDIYNDPLKALGPPDAAGFGPVNYTGFVSLGFGGRVTLDLGGCLTDRPGADVRVFQAVTGEPVSVYVSPSPDGPFTLVGARIPCGERFSGIQGYCDFDFAAGGVTRARYVRVEDGELFPCPGGSVSEGADLDAVQALGVAAGAASAASAPAR
jgi:hypothetical protein